MGQQYELDDLNTDYDNDPDFDSLRGPGINFVPGTGVLNPTFMVVGEGPGKMENARRLPFVGQAGQQLFRLMSLSGEFHEDKVYITNAVKYMPVDSSNKLRPLTAKEISLSSWYLKREIDIVNPDLVILCGRSALQTIYPGQEYSVTKYNGKLLDGKYAVVYHPAVLLYPSGARTRNKVEYGYRNLRAFVAQRTEQ